MNYTALQQAIQDYTQNYESTFVANIPVFVQQAEERIYNTVQFPSLRKNVTGTCGAADPYVAAPLDFLAVYSISVIDSTGDYAYLLNKDVNFIRESFPTASYQAQPQYYALFGPQSNNEQELTFFLGPTPDKTYTLELHYFYYPQSIVTAGMTWLSDNFDPVLLYGSLIEAYTFMKGEADMVQLYEGKYKEALAMAKRLGDGMERQDAYRSGQFRQQVT
jgi:hypothetical protein